nr:MAG TPA: hypothetical protein [Crassvirales sp.]
MRICYVWSEKFTSNPKILPFYACFMNFYPYWPCMSLCFSLQIYCVQSSIKYRCANVRLI